MSDMASLLAKFLIAMALVALATAQSSQPAAHKDLASPVDFSPFYAPSLFQRAIAAIRAFLFYIIGISTTLGIDAGGLSEGGKIVARLTIDPSFLPAAHINALQGPTISPFIVMKELVAQNQQRAASNAALGADLAQLQSLVRLTLALAAVMAFLCLLLASLALYLALNQKNRILIVPLNHLSVIAFGPDPRASPALPVNQGNAQVNVALVPQDAALVDSSLIRPVFPISSIDLERVARLETSLSRAVNPISAEDIQAMDDALFQQDAPIEPMIQNHPVIVDDYDVDAVLASSLNRAVVPIPADDLNSDLNSLFAEENSLVDSSLARAVVPIPSSDIIAMEDAVSISDLAEDSSVDDVRVVDSSLSRALVPIPSDDFDRDLNSLCNDSNSEYEHVPGTDANIGPTVARDAMDRSLSQTVVPIPSEMIANKRRRLDQSVIPIHASFESLSVWDSKADKLSKIRNINRTRALDQAVVPMSSALLRATGNIISANYNHWNTRLIEES